jgi:tellurite resistance protein TerC
LGKRIRSRKKLPCTELGVQLDGPGSIDFIRPKTPHAMTDALQAFPPWAWIAFLAFISVMLAIDLGVFHREVKEIRMKEALGWCTVWVTLALTFNLIVTLWLGPHSGLEFLTGYLIELSLSVDNVFVFIVIFAYFKVPVAYHHRVLFWGILGAVFLRAIFIFAGIEIITRFHWVIYIFGAFLVYTGIKMARPQGEGVEIARNPVVRLITRYLPVSKEFSGSNFFVRQGGRWLATPLFLVLVVIDCVDVVFAFDSIPAILAITQDSFIVFTSNIFAILGLRSIYFAVSSLMKFCRYLSYGLALILIFVGCKMLLADFFQVSIEFSLGFVALVLIVTIAASALNPIQKTPEKAEKPRIRDA